MRIPFTVRKPFELGAAGTVERIARRLRYHTSYSRNKLAPPLSAAQQAAIEELRREGTVILSGYVRPELLLQLQRDTQQALEELDFETPCLAQSRIDPIRHKDLLDNFLLASGRELEQRGAAFTRAEAKDLQQVVHEFQPSTLTTYVLSRSAAFRSAWLDPYLLGIVCGYLGLVPKLVEAYVRRNFPAKFWTMNHYWHRDLNDRHQLLKMFVFLSDTTIDNGPHEFIRGSHRDLSRLNGKLYYSDSEVDALHPAGSDTRLVTEVKAGTVIIEDTRGLHRARMPTSGYRDLGYAVFMPVADGVEPRLYMYPSVAFENLSDFQRAFIPTGNLS